VSVFPPATTRPSERRAPGRTGPAVLLALLAAGCATPGRSSVDPDTQAFALAQLPVPDPLAECHARRGPEVTPPHPFTSDGCSVWPDDGWAACCVLHDVDYWCGGSAADRERADRRLRECVSHESATMGSLMWLGVRVGGAPCVPAPWRWGYGWDYPAGYTPE
jgi:hypothetical protein